MGKPAGRGVVMRRYLAIEKLNELREGETIGPRLKRVYDVRRNGWTEFVGVAADDPRLDTVEVVPPVGG